jgi:hypothetical protein
MRMSMRWLRNLRLHIGCFASAFSTANAKIMTMSSSNYSARWTVARGTRPVRIANCSGYKGDSSPTYGLLIKTDQSQGIPDIICFTKHS